MADAFLAEADRKRLIWLAKDRLQRAQIGSETKVLETSEARSNSDAYLAPTDVPEAAALMARIAPIVGLSASHGEGVSVLRYTAGQEFKPHVDGIWSGASEMARTQFEADGGQRLFTTIVYLNAVDGGGATVFPRLNLNVPPNPGRLLLFANSAAGSSDVTPEAIHAAEPVTKGEKWAAVCWWRERAFAGSAHR
ncbi:MAG: 2OG-Fe(II) oxygenase [Pseudomonadota bacterium]